MKTGLGEECMDMDTSELISTYTTTTELLPKKNSGGTSVIDGKRKKGYTSTTEGLDLIMKIIVGMCKGIADNKQRSVQSRWLID